MVKVDPSVVTVYPFLWIVSSPIQGSSFHDSHDAVAKPVTFQIDFSRSFFGFLQLNIVPTPNNKAFYVTILQDSAWHRHVAVTATSSRTTMCCLATRCLEAVQFEAVCFTLEQGNSKNEIFGRNT
jgi:hypothetical protein